MDVSVELRKVWPGSFASGLACVSCCVIRTLILVQCVVWVAIRISIRVVNVNDLGSVNLTYGVAGLVRRNR